MLTNYAAECLSNAIESLKDYRFHSISNALYWIDKALDSLKLKMNAIPWFDELYHRELEC